jgi:DNA replication and repair protein RecF
LTYPQHITSLSLFHFRNYASAHLSLEQAPVVLVGPNGSGKTNILEALSLFAPGKGLRGAPLAELPLCTLPEMEQQWSINLELDTNIHCQTAVEKRPLKQDRRFHKIQHAPAKSTANFSEWFTITWLTPETDRLFLEGPSTRRKFVDRLIYAEDPLHLDRLNAYDHLLKERMTVLKTTGNAQWLTSLEGQLAEFAVAITITRHQMMEKLQAGQQYQHAIFPQFSCAMIGGIDTLIQSKNATQCEEELKELYQSTRLSDRDHGSTQWGPHRSDWRVIHYAKNMEAALCSTGEQKILLLGTVLAFIQQKIRTDQRFIILLLDDIIAHLDFYHRMVLFEQIHALQFEAQQNYFGCVHTWFSGTDAEWFDPLHGRAQFFAVDNGTVTPR